MKKDLLMWDETLFRDIGVFEIDYIPEEFNHRDEQIQELAFQIRPGMHGGRPLNSIIRGVPGTGKTTSVKKIFSDVEDTTKKIVPVYVNCQNDNTKFAIFSQIYQKISGRLPPATGTSFKQLFDSVARILLRDEKVLLVALDDANYILYENEINKVLYTLIRSHETYEGLKIGVIAIISDMSVELINEIDPRVASVFRPSEIYFPPYGYDEIRAILKERVLHGFYPNVVPPEILDLVTEKTMNSGDLRVGIDLLKRAGLQAEKAARRIIESDDICSAYSVSKYLHLSYTLRTLKNEEKDILRIIAEMNHNSADTTTGNIHKSAKEEIGMGYTKYYEIVKKLDALRLINLNYREGKGRTRIISLRYDPIRVIEQLK